MHFCLWRVLQCASMGMRRAVEEHMRLRLLHLLGQDLFGACQSVPVPFRSYFGDGGESL